MSDIEKSGSTEGVENLSTSKRSSNIEVGNITQELAKVQSSTPNPTKAPLNYIDNMDEREETFKKYKHEVTEKQRELASILQDSEDKSDELNYFREEKAKIDAEQQKIVGSLCTKLLPRMDFLQEVAIKVNEGIEKYLMDNDQSAQELTEYPQKQEIIVRVDRELSQEEKEEIIRSLQNQGLDTENLIINYEINLKDSETVDLDESMSYEDIDDSDEGHEDEGQNVAQVQTQEEIPSILKTYFQLVSSWKEFEPLLSEDAHKQGMKNLMENVKNLEEKYRELQSQSYFLGEKIEKLEFEVSNIDNAGVNCENEIISLNEEMEKKNQSYFLDSYVSTKKVSLDDFVATPMVEKQIKHIINLYKKGLPAPKTILLYGGHNLGKTYAANVLSGELNLKMYHIRSYDINTGGYSDPNTMLDTIFEGITKKKEPCIIFLDEMENLSGGAEGSTYQRLFENTIRHHISKIKESNREIIIIGAIAEGGKLDPRLLKQDVFSKQIIFEKYGPQECKKLFQQIISKKGIKLGNDVNLDELVSKIPDSEGERNPEYIKGLIDKAIDCHLLSSDNFDSDLILSKADIQAAMKSIGEYYSSTSERMGFKNH